VPALALLLFFESGVEFTSGGFISTYVTSDIAVGSVTLASWVLAGYWAAIMASRAVLSGMSLRSDPYTRLRLCAGGAALGALLAAAAPLVPWPMPFIGCAVALCGWSLAGIYPTVLGVAGARFESHSGTVFGILFAVALSGGMILPWTAGQIGGAAGLRWVFVLIAGSFVAILGLSIVAGRVDRPRKP
jgi:fucose permease